MLFRVMVFGKEMECSSASWSCREPRDQLTSHYMMMRSNAVRVTRNQKSIDKTTAAKEGEGKTWLSFVSVLTNSVPIISATHDRCWFRTTDARENRYRHLLGIFWYHIWCLKKPNSNLKGAQKTENQFQCLTKKICKNLQKSTKIYKKY